MREGEDQRNHGREVLNGHPIVNVDTGNGIAAELGLEHALAKDDA